MSSQRPPTHADIAKAIVARCPGDAYLAYHAPRYATLTRELLELRPAHDRPVLEVGRSRFTPILADQLGCRIDTLGLPLDEDTATSRHYHFDLNDAQEPSRWRTDVPAYDVVVFAEVLEHLHTAPSLVLEYLRTLVRPGGTLLIQTPNAVAFHKRLQMVLGANPYERFREDLGSPGHYREYTAAELRGYAERAGFSVLRMSYESYFDYRYRGHGKAGTGPKNGTVSRLANLFYRCCPGAWKPGITAVLRAPGEAASREVSTSPAVKDRSANAPAAAAACE